MRAFHPSSVPPLRYRTERRCPPRRRSAARCSKGGRRGAAARPLVGCSRVPRLARLFAPLAAPKRMAPAPTQGRAAQGSQPPTRIACREERAASTAQLPFRPAWPAPCGRLLKGSSASPSALPGLSLVISCPHHWTTCGEACSVRQAHRLTELRLQRGSELSAWLRCRSPKVLVRLGPSPTIGSLTLQDLLPGAGLSGGLARAGSQWPWSAPKAQHRGVRSAPHFNSILENGIRPACRHPLGVSPLSALWVRRATPNHSTI